MAARDPRGRGLGRRVPGLQLNLPGNANFPGGRPLPLPSQAQPLPLPPGETEQPSAVALEDLEKGQLLGSGTGGRVYKVRHNKTGQEYALKIIQEKHEEEVRKQIVREMEILQKANCQQIVRCYGIYDNFGEISFVLELMDGGTLADVVKAKGGLIEQHIAEITRQVLQGLFYLHRQHVVHRDIKPSNLLINSHGEVKIADFGVSSVLANTMAQCTSYVGTSAYLSPERINPPAGGGEYNGYASDVWSLGVTLLELALGRFPFGPPGQVADWMTLFGAIVYNDPPQAPEHFSPQFRDFISSCLQKDFNKRASISALIQHPFASMHQETAWADLRTLLQ